MNTDLNDPLKEGIKKAVIRQVAEWWRARYDNYVAMNTEIKVTHIIPRVWCYYQNNGAGGWLHIVLDDGNTDMVAGCLDAAIANGDTECEALVRELLQWTHDEVEVLYERYNEYCLGAPRPEGVTDEMLEAMYDKMYRT